MKSPEEEKINPKHVAIIMDGNNRWAKSNGLLSNAGHQRGVERAREAVEFAVEKNFDVLTLFTFSSENWGRTDEEVNFLMELFADALQREVPNLIKNGVELKFIGDLNRFDKSLLLKIHKSEQDTKCYEETKKLDLIIAASYGGRWDIVQAVRKMADDIKNIDEVDEDTLSTYLSLSNFPEPDLCIRTGGEIRISNFLLWQLAYSEFYFTDVLWPDFDASQFELALKDFTSRTRRFGNTSNFKEN